MTKLIFSMITSLDGYVEDAGGSFDWARPDEEVFRFANEHVATLGTYLFGRRMYETMVFWETAGTASDPDPISREFGEMWRATNKIVYSTSLATASSARTRIERVFDPAVIQDMKTSEERDIAVAGPNLAAQAFRAGLVDECRLFVVPVAVGGGKPALPREIRLHFELVSEHKFRSGVVFLLYRYRAAESTVL
ncbi:MAG: dihydrofolate reductase family protein [Acidimicrobiales bacterium]